MVAVLLAGRAAALVPDTPLAGPPAPPDPLPLGRADAALIAAAGAVALALGLGAGRLTPSRCRLCGLDALDEETRELVRSRNLHAAATTSDLLANALVPAGAVAALLGGAWAAGSASEGLADVVPVLEAALLGTDLELATKEVSARYRPSANGTGRGDKLRSFFSGHTTLAFSIAVSAADVATLRGWRAAPWFWAVGLALAAGVGWARMAADAHWLTDVLAGAATGVGAGMAAPLWIHRRARGPPVTLRTAPGGLALDF